MTGTRRIVQVTGVLVALVGMYAFWPLPEIPTWEEPVTEQERKARDFAHSIVLPDSVPKPVPFNFALARLRALVPGMPNVSEQYFKHLCDTEAGQYIFKTVENVDGFLQMRPRPRHTDIKLMDPFIVESAVGLYGSAGERYERRATRPTGGPSVYVQPPIGLYQYIEQPSLDSESIDLFYRSAVNADPLFPRSGMQTINPVTGAHERIPYIIAIRSSRNFKSRYGYTWRGLRRADDRYYWISGGEVIVLEIDTRRVLGVYLEFKLAQGKYPRWDTSRWCGNSTQYDLENLFVQQILIPNVAVNDNVKTLKND